MRKATRLLVRICVTFCAAFVAVCAFTAVHLYVNPPEDWFDMGLMPVLLVLFSATGTAVVVLLWMEMRLVAVRFDMSTKTEFIANGVLLFGGALVWLADSLLTGGDIYEIAANIIVVIVGFSVFWLSQVAVFELSGVQKDRMGVS